MVKRSFGPRRSVSLEIHTYNNMGVDMDRYLHVLLPAFLPRELEMLASCHHVETQPLVVEERWGLLLGRWQSLWNCEAGFVVLESSKDGMWVRKESCSSLRLLSCFWKGRYFETDVSFSQGHVSDFEHCSRVSQKMRPSLGFRLESRSEQMRRRHRSWLYGRLSLQWRGFDES